MANIKKSFNFRNGVQVDNDNFIVNSNGLVGIGSTIPTESLDVAGNVKIRGTLFADSIEGNIVNTSEYETALFTGVNIGLTSITSGIITATTGIVTYYGDAQYLQNMPTSQWVDVDSGFGYTSIYSAGNVGISTTYPDYTFQVGVTTGGVGITSDGDIVIGRNINVSGVGTIDGNLSVGGTTTSYSFSGFGTDISGINASNISTGTISEQRLPSNINKIGGIATFSSFHGNLVGIATTAISLVSEANIDITSIDSDYSNLGVTTVSSFNASVSIGIGTNNPNSDFHLRKTGSDAKLQITSDSNIARIVLGNDVTINSNNTIFSFNDTSLTAHSESGENCFDIKNYAPGNFNSYLRPQSDPEPLKFNWINDLTNSVLMSLSSNGNLGIGKINPTETFEVVGTSTITSHSYVGGNFIVSGIITGNSLSITQSSTFNGATFNKKVSISTESTGYSLEIGSPFTLNAGGTSGTGVGIGSIGNINASGTIRANKFIGIGSQITQINAGSITGTLGDISINTTTGIITAKEFVGIGSQITQISPSNISSGTLGDISINTTTGIITAKEFIGAGYNMTGLKPQNIVSGEFGGSSYTFSSSVGIGTTNAISKLTVDGDGYFTGIITANQFTTQTGGTPTIDSPNNLNINANVVAISSDVTVGRDLTVSGDAIVGVNTSSGVILTSPNGTQYRLIVDNSGNLSTAAV